MNVSPINDTSFGKVSVKDNKNTRAAVETFLKDKSTLDFFNKSLDALDEISEGYPMVLSAEKGKCAYVFSLKSVDDPEQSCSAAVPNSYMHTAHERNEGFTNAINYLVTVCQNVIEKMQTSVSDSDIDEIFKSRK